MNILWLTHRDPLNPKAGGSERIVLEISKRLVESGSRLTIFAPTFKNSMKVENFKGIEIVRVGGYFVSHLSLPVFLIKRNFDIVIVDLGQAVPWISPYILGKKFVVHFLHLHRRSLPGQINKFLAFIFIAIEKSYFLLYHNAPFITISNTSLKDLTDSLYINQEQTAIINPGVNAELFSPLPKTKNPSLVYFGGFRDYKRPWEVLFVLKELLEIDNTISLTMIGAGPSFTKTKNIARKLDVINKVNFIGRVDDVELAKIVGTSWVNVHSSITEGWGISIVEAGAAGTPTVAYDVPGVKDIIKNGVNGFLVEDGNRKCMAKSVIEIINDFTLFSEGSINESKKYSWDKAASEWKSHLESIIKNNK